MRFINGARIVQPGVCVSSNVTLNVIDRVLMPGDMTIASILSDDPNFSNFVEALRFTRVFDFLDNDEGVSRTVLAPNNQAFDRLIPTELFSCLMYMRLPLHDLVLYHIAQSAEYTSSLALRQGLHTLHLSSLRLMGDSSNITFLTVPPSSIVVPNITASNGVIHYISDVLIPPTLDFGMCSDRVPTTVPDDGATTPEPDNATTPSSMMFESIEDRLDDYDHYDNNP